MEWHKEGARGFSILTRVPPQTALAIVADKSAQFGEILNAKLDTPSKSVRERRLISSDEENVSNLVTSDPVSSFLFFFLYKIIMVFKQASWT